MTAYKYVARDAESRVNWGDISKTWSDAILKVEADREAKRQTIKTETDELANKLIEAPRGQHQGANEWTAGYADMQREALLERYRQLTSGNLALRDWNSSLANATQSTEQMFNLSKVYQEEYASIMERDQNMESQEAELALAAEFEGFTNFTETVPLVDPVTLSAKIGRQVYDPETGTYKVGETITMNGMYNLLKGRYNRFDIQAAAAEDVKTLGKYTTVIMDGKVKTRENWQDDPLYNKELDAKIDVHFSDPQNITSVLTNAMDSGYSTTGLLDNALDREGNVDDKKVFWVTNPAQASAGAKTPLISLDIELDKNGNIVGRSAEELDNIFGEDVSDETRVALVRAANEQRKQAKEFMRTYYTAEVDLIETPRQEFADTGGRGPTKTQLDYAKLTDRVQYALDNWMALQYANTSTEKEKAEEAIVGQFYQGKEVLGADVTSGDVKLTLKDGEMINIERKSADGTPFNAVQWAEQGNFLYEDPAVARNLIRQKQAGEAPYGSMTGVLAGRPAFVQQTIPNFLEKKVTTEGGEEKKVSEVVADLPKVGPIGDIDNANEAVTQLKSMFSDLKLLDADVRAHDEQTVVDAGQKSSDYADYPAISIYLPRQMEVPVVIPAYQEAYDSFFNALASAMERGIPLTEAEMKSMLHDGAQGYNNEKIRKELGLTSSIRRTSGGGGAGAASRLYNSGG
jgi:hypothetical protein